MRTLMTFVACFEFAQHLRVVRYTMTILTLWNYSMFVGMAEYTLESRMLGGAGFKGTPDVRMTCAAGKVGNVTTVGKLQGLMNLMTLDTVLKFLFFNMRFMAV